MKEIPTDAEARAQVEKLLASVQFASAERHRKLLAYLSERAARPPTESEIAVEVLGRKASSFDPRTDSIVRVELTRLRTRLSEYYASSEDRVVVDLPKRSYRLEYKYAAVASPDLEAAKAGGWSWLVIAAAAAALTASGVFLFTRNVAKVEGGTPYRVTPDAGLSWQPAVSPDGKLIAYSSDRANAGGMDIWVQQAAGGPPLRITSGTEDESEPAFSADGSLVAFRSDKEGGGVYVVPALGGEPKLLAAGGRRPRFSPDGKWLAYWTGNEHGRFPASRLWVVAAGGGTPRQLAAGLQATELRLARFPVWRADSRAVLFVGATGDAKTQDWFVSELTGGAAVATGVRRVLLDAGLRGQRMNTQGLVPLDWTERHVMFAAQKRGEDNSTNLWRIAVHAMTGKVQGQPERMTSGAGVEMQGTRAGNRLIYSSVIDHPDLWVVPFDGGAPRALTSDLVVEYRPSISADGQWLLFDSPRVGARGIWARNLETAAEQAVSVGSMPESSWRNWPVISHDGAMAAYQQGTGDVRAGSVFVRALAAGAKEQKVCERCLAWDWFWKSRRVLVHSYEDGHFHSVDAATGEREDFGPLEDSAGEVSVAPDDASIVYLRAAGDEANQIVVRPWKGVSRALVEGSWNDKPRWATDGRAVYYLSDRDGWLCMWKQDVAGGEAQAVRHFHSTRTRLSNLPSAWLAISVSRGGVVYNANEITGNVWSLVQP
ncbi:MAG: PD40 domain-containing protein [Acidobacteria bacterium]|nr:PD40 domain-containing protein [Acidobacteriota bacterium]